MHKTRRCSKHMRSSWQLCKARMPLRTLVRTRRVFARGFVRGNERGNWRNVHMFFENSKCFRFSEGLVYGFFTNEMAAHVCRRFAAGLWFWVVGNVRGKITCCRYDEKRDHCSEVFGVVLGSSSVLSDDEVSPVREAFKFHELLPGVARERCGAGMCVLNGSLRVSSAVSQEVLCSGSHSKLQYFIDSIFVHFDFSRVWVDFQLQHGMRWQFQVGFRTGFPSDSLRGFVSRWSTRRGNHCRSGQS